jgi:hypothetical protein
MKNNLLKMFSACLPALSTATLGGPLGMAFIVTAMMFSASANAQIVYTDVNPDFTVAGSNSYYLDLNYDGTSDYMILRVNGVCGFNCSSNWISDSVLNGNAAAGSTDPLAMNFGNTISSGIGWSGSGILYRLNTLNSVPPTNTTSGNWSPGNEHYLGLKLIVGSSTYYGWVRMQTASSPLFGNVSCTIKDYAYNSIPNQPILAGQTATTGITENSFASSINLFPNPADNHLTIDLGSNNKKAEVTITDITGKIIYTTTANETNKIELNTGEFAEGMYIVKIQSGKFISTKKLIVKK